MKIKISVIIMIGISLGIKAQITDTGGNVGIGTTNPNTKLDIQVNATTFESFLKTRTSDASGDYLLIKNATGANGQLIPCVEGRHITDNRQALYLSGLIAENNDSGHQPIMIFDSRIDAKPVKNRPLFGWDTYGKRRMILTADGNLGIGTTNPNSWKLAVNGKIRAKEIKIETGWSDFVFYDDYKLPTLKEVESYIKKKGHLKDIPSAKDVEENGIFLGEMDAKLLQKIEELTLYTIQQEKRLNNLELKNEKLEEENKTLKTMNSKLLELQKRLEKLEKK